MRCTVSVVVLIAVVVLGPTASHALRLRSCGDVQTFFGRPLPSDPYARQSDLEEVVRYLGDVECGPLFKERALWSYADALDRYSQAFRDAPARKSWGEKATTAYEAYLGWLLDLSDAARDDMISRLIGIPRQQPDFRAESLSWLRRRPGNALNAVGALYVGHGQQPRLFASFWRFGRKNVGIVPDEVVREWHKWLRSQDDFSRDRTDAEIRGLIGSRNAVRAAWADFKSLLREYVKANPSMAEDWSPVLRQVSQWVP